MIQAVSVVGNSKKACENVDDLRYLTKPPK